MSMSTELAIVGCGARTPVGLNRRTSAAAVRAGISRITEHPFMLDRFGEPMKVARDARLDPHLEGSERLAALAIPAAQEALAPLAGRPSAKIVMTVGHGNKRPGHDDRAAAALLGALCDSLRALVTIEDVLHSGEGHAAGIWAMQAAQRLIWAGRIDAVLAGAVDSYLSRDTLEWLDDHEQLHSDENIYGFCPGEAAGFVLITRMDIARYLGSPPLTSLVSVGTGREPNRINTEDICLGDGLSGAFREATNPLGSHEKIDRIICDMNGERYRGNEYGFAVLKCPGRFKNAASFEAPADCWGDVGAASGPLYASLVIEAEARRYAKGPLSLIWASSETGLRAAAVLRGQGAS
jgi:3-oxoacyl-[acyl-carrier-protein] synthase I